MKLIQIFFLFSFLFIDLICFAASDPFFSSLKVVIDASDSNVLSENVVKFLIVSSGPSDSRIDVGFMNQDGRLYTNESLRIKKPESYAEVHFANPDKKFNFSYTVEVSDGPEYKFFTSDPIPLPATGEIKLSYRRSDLKVSRLIINPSNIKFIANKADKIERKTLPKEIRCRVMAGKYQPKIEFNPEINDVAPIALLVDSNTKIKIECQAFYFARLSQSFKRNGDLTLNPEQDTVVELSDLDF